MFRTDLTEQPSLFAFTVRDLIAEDSDVWLYIDLFDALDLEDFDGDYVSQGKPGIAPKLMLRSLFYGLTHGIVTGRKLADVCCNDSRYIVLSGEQRPDSRTFQRFLIRHAQRLDALFVQVVRLAQKMGLVSLGKVALDGSRFKANTSKHKAMSYGRMNQALSEIRSDLTRLKEDLARENSSERTEPESKLEGEIKLREKRLAKILAAKASLEKEHGEEVPPDSAQKSFHDHDAMPMAKKNDAFIYGYNCQAAVDETSQIIVAADLHDAPNDYGATAPMLGEIKANCDKAAERVLVDSGYRSNENITTIESSGSTPYVATGKGEAQADDGIERDVILTKGPDGAATYLCPAGKKLRGYANKGEGTLSARLPRRACKTCPLAGGCPLLRRGKRIRLPKPEHFVAVAGNLARMRTPEGKAVYARRKVIVEPVFGNLKNKGIRIVVRGRGRVRTWWRVAATAHNIEKIIRSMTASRQSALLAAACPG